MCAYRLSVPLFRESWHIWRQHFGPSFRNTSISKLSVLIGFASLIPWLRTLPLDLVEMFNCIVDTVEDWSSVRSYRKFLIANFCYKYIHKTIKLTEHYNTLKNTASCSNNQKVIIIKLSYFMLNCHSHAISTTHTGKYIQWISNLCAGWSRNVT